MLAGVVVAIITAFTSLVIAILNARSTRNRERQAREAERAEKLEEQKASVKVELDRIREPLIIAALDLVDRIDNLRLRRFLGTYLTAVMSIAVKSRALALVTASRSTGAFVQRLYDNVTLHRLLQEDELRPLCDILNEIAHTFASDRYDGRRFMVWRDEQRAIAEEMRTDETPEGCIGFATFAARYDDTFAHWFASFDQDLDEEAAVKSRRLKILQHNLAMLVHQLDPDQAYGELWTWLTERSGSD
jgi:hypothetical protein